MFEAKIIADSICEGSRLTTMQITHWTALQAELNTHCAFAKNASSARAIPLNKAIERVENEPFLPIFWGKARAGMSPIEEVDANSRSEAIALWLQARDYIVDIVKKMDALGLHKQLPSRLMAPFSWITVAITGDNAGWSNFFNQRCHKDAQQEFQHVAYLAQREYFESTPDVLKPGEWHLPYVQKEEKSQHDLHDLVQLSVARTARTSYLTQEGKRDNEKDFELFWRLAGMDPKHLSPTEQVCECTPGVKSGKYDGWTAYRKSIPNEYVTDFQPNYKQYFGE
jgi:hypothetical protein